ncbi:DNA replication licensing factor MCM4-like [Apium graveolens]|uniref:DNA replication licensing factor MCM4-like n=1 Tax=Apium graveolens TaxID=4045 RepID=UPI003D7B4222
MMQTYIDCLHLKKYDKSRMNEFSKLQVDQLKELSRKPDIYERLTKSLAPNMWDLDDVKKGLLCQIFDGSALILQSWASFREDINILLLGDPGTSKS